MMILLKELSSSYLSNIQPSHQQPREPCVIENSFYERERNGFSDESGGLMGPEMHLALEVLFYMFLFL